MGNKLIDFKSRLSELESERLIIKNGTLEDFIKVYEFNFNKLEDIAGEFEYVKQDPSYIESWFEDGIDSYYKKLKGDNNFDLILYLKDNTPVGNLLIDRINEEENSIEITCNVHPSYWGCGYMMEAILGILPHLFEMGYDSVIYSYGEGNTKSARLCSKIGFELDRIIENDYVRNNKQISTFRNILTKDKYNELYKRKGL